MAQQLKQLPSLVTTSRRITRRIALCALGLVLGACQTSGSSRADDAAEFVVMATVFPLAEVARAVAGDGAEVEQLAPAGVEPHDLELRSQDLDRLEVADVVLYLGGGFQPAVQEALSGRGADEAIDLLAAEHGDDASDPHVWLDPVAMIEVTNRVRDVFAEQHPAARDTFFENAAAYVAKLTALDEQFSAGLANCERRTIVTSHRAFGHLAGRYGLEQEAIAGFDPESEPNPARLAELTELVARTGTTTVFTEEVASAKVGEALAREAGVATAVLNTIEVGPAPSGDEIAGQAYLDLMQQNLATLRSALACD